MTPAARSSGRTAGLARSSPAAGSSGCLGSLVLAKLGRSMLLVGASMSGSVARSAPFDLRYVYISGSIFDRPERAR